MLFQNNKISLLFLLLLSLIVCKLSHNICSTGAQIQRLDIITGDIFVLGGILFKNVIKYYLWNSNEDSKGHIFIVIIVIYTISLICSFIKTIQGNFYCESFNNFHIHIAIWLDFLLCLPIFSYLVISSYCFNNHWYNFFPFIVWLLVALIAISQMLRVITPWILSLVLYVILLAKFPSNIELNDTTVIHTDIEISQININKLRANVTNNNIHMIIYKTIPAFYIINLFSVINIDLLHKYNYDQTILLIVFNVFYKIYLTTVISYKNTQLIDEEKSINSKQLISTLTRKDILKFVFHEIRNPLNSISIGLDLFDNSTNLNHIEKESLMMMGESVNYMSETLNDILLMQMIEDGAMKLYKSKFLIRDAIMHCVNSSRLKADNKNIRIMINYDLNMPLSVVGDRSRFEHALINLLSLAIRFTSEGNNINISVESKFTDDKCNVKIDIDGDKLNIPYDEYQLLYQPFCGKLRTAETTSLALPGYSSSGLSFLLAKDIIEMHGGSVDFTQMNGNAVRISFIIPFDIISDGYSKSNSNFISTKPSLQINFGRSTSYPEDLDLMQIQSLTKSDSPDSLINVAIPFSKEILKSKTSELIILIVDDSSTNRKILSLAFTKRGFTCDCAENGKEAVDKVKQNSNYSLIFMDNSMPVMNGIDATKLIREAGYKNLIFGLTGNSLKEDIVSLSEAGADTVISKPLRPGQINAIINYLDENGCASDNNYKIIMNRDTFEKLQLDSEGLAKIDISITERSISPKENNDLKLESPFRSSLSLSNHFNLMEIFSPSNTKKSSSPNTPNIFKSKNV